MIFSRPILLFILLVIAFFIQLFIPVINIDGIILVPDILIIFLTYFGLYYGRFETILIGFLFGILQDFSTQWELLGIMSLVKSIIGYFLGTLALYRSIWNIRFRLFIIFIIYNLHFACFYFVSLNSISLSKIFLIKIIFIQSIVSFFILLFVDKTIINNGVLK